MRKLEATPGKLAENRSETCLRSWWGGQGNVLISFLKHICARIQLAASSSWNGLQGSGSRIAFLRMKSLERGTCYLNLSEPTERFPGLSEPLCGIAAQPCPHVWPPAGCGLIIRAASGMYPHQPASVPAHLSTASLASLTCFDVVSQETLIHLCLRWLYYLSCIVI